MQSRDVNGSIEVYAYISSNLPKMIILFTFISAFLLYCIYFTKQINPKLTNTTATE